MLPEVGAAVKLLPLEVVARHTAVDWRGWAGLCEVVSNQYFSLELSRLRPTIMDERPLPLEAVTRELVAHDPSCADGGRSGYPQIGG